jgi:hypothetical protein
MKFKQTTPFGCGMYAVAHAVNIPEFVTESRLELSALGNNIWELNQWLREDGYDFHIDVIYCNLLSSLTPLPDEGFSLIPQIGEVYCPLLLNVGWSTEGKNHMVAIHAAPNGNVILKDSLKEDSILTDWKDIVSGKHYPIIIGIYGFVRNDPKVSGWVMMEIPVNSN